MVVTETKTLLFDRIALSTLLVSESAVQGGLMLTGELRPAIFDLTRLDTGMRYSAPIAQWTEGCYPNLAPPPYDLWCEWHSQALDSAVGCYLRGRDVVADLGDAAVHLGDNLVYRWLIGGHLFFERPRSREVVQLGDFKLSLNAVGRADPAGPLIFANHWDRQFPEIDETTVAALTAPPLMLLTLLHGDIPLERRDPKWADQRTFTRRHKRPLASHLAPDEGPTMIALSERMGERDYFPAVLSQARDLFDRDVPPIETLVTQSLATGFISVGLERHPGRTEPATAALLS